MEGELKNMEIITNYYDYEYDVLKEMNKIFDLKNISVDSKIIDITANKSDRPTNYDDSSDVKGFIKFIFKNGFEISINRYVLVDSFNMHNSLGFTINMFREEIEEGWLMQIYRED